MRDRADLHASVTRIADLESLDYEVEPLPRDEWSRGDYVVARVSRRPGSDVRVENTVGRRVELMEGESLVGALGTRRATRGYVGGWRDVEADGSMQVLTGGGVLGRVTSTSPFSPRPIDVDYVGHVLRDGVVKMEDHSLDGDGEVDVPVVLVTGTSMSAGKTMSGRVLTRVLVEEGYDVAGCKLTGAGTYNDVLALEVAGADPIYDFVDAGLPTTVVEEGVYRQAITGVLDAVSSADVVVAEVGASPLEPYNGEAAVDLLGDAVAFSVLCATDPYAVVGIEEAFDVEPDVVAGIATNTSAGVDLVEELAGRRALNLGLEDAKQPLREMLLEALG
ncbi:MAG: hypothetical protein ACOCT0_05045 [Halobacteriota archaeon]